MTAAHDKLVEAADRYLAEKGLAMWGRSFSVYGAERRAKAVEWLVAQIEGVEAGLVPFTGFTFDNTVIHEVITGLVTDVYTNHLFATRDAPHLPQATVSYEFDTKPGLLSYPTDNVTAHVGDTITISFSSPTETGKDA